MLQGMNNTISQELNSQNNDQSKPNKSSLKRQKSFTNKNIPTVNFTKALDNLSGIKYIV